MAYVADLASQVNQLRDTLQWIKDNLGQVCEEFAYTCTHESCNASCSAWLVADGALDGNFEFLEQGKSRTDPVP